ncbi:MAG: ATP-binding protein [Methanobrevibacter sp.]|nr:ATP-binding protein [Methanobrevibacter sp.]
MDDAIENYLIAQLANNPIIINSILEDTRCEGNYRYVFNEITQIIDNFIQGDLSSRYLVLPGLRGTGKTTLMYQIYQYLINEKKVPHDEVLFIDAENLMARMSLNLDNVLNYFIDYFHDAHPVLNKKIFLLVDKTQYDPNWEKTAKLIFNSHTKVFMIFTGSSALELEISADSARRGDKIPVDPLNFKEYLDLKYGFKSPDDIGETLLSLILSGPNDDLLAKAQDLEREIHKNFHSLPRLSDKEWEHYVRYSGFPYEFDLRTELSESRTDELIRRVVMNDVDIVHSTRFSSKVIASYILQIIASQKPGEIAQNKIREIINAKDDLNTTNKTVSQLLDTLVKTKLIFDIKPYGSQLKSMKRPWKYYFLHPSLKHALWKGTNIAIRDKKQILGILAENLVASLLYIANDRKKLFEIYYDPEKGGVDFLLNTFDSIIPVEVGIGEKNLKQVKKAMARYNSEYGVFVSNRTKTIQLEENIICIPLKTFSFI